MRCVYLVVEAANRSLSSTGRASLYVLCRYLQHVQWGETRFETLIVELTTFDVLWVLLGELRESGRDVPMLCCPPGDEPSPV